MTDAKGPFVHPDGRCESTEVGDGTRIWAFAHVMKGAKVGAQCNIGEGAFVESGARIGDCVTIKNGVSVWDCVTVADYAFLGPGAVFTNDFAPRSHPDFKTSVADFRKTEVCMGATIGANATIVCGNRIGAWAFVGAGAVVTKNVPAHALVFGNPAVCYGFVCKCGAKLDGRNACTKCRRVYVSDGAGGMRER